VVSVTPRIRGNGRPGREPDCATEEEAHERGAGGGHDRCEREADPTTEPVEPAIRHVLSVRLRGAEIPDNATPEPAEPKPEPIARRRELRRFGGVALGQILAETGFGKVEIGVLDGVAAWLDLDTRFGRVQSDLDRTERPAPGEDAVEVRARTAFGDLTVRRSSAVGAGGEQS
jgi:hypothetical protein